MSVARLSSVPSFGNEGNGSRSETTSYNNVANPNIDRGLQGPQIRRDDAGIMSSLGNRSD